MSENDTNSKVTPVVKKPEAAFFYTKHYIYQWSSGPSVQTLNPDTYEPIASLAEARELATRFSVESYREDKCVTEYGVKYSL